MPIDLAYRNLCLIDGSRDRPLTADWIVSFFVLFVNEYKAFRRWGYECFLVIIVEVDVLDPVSVDGSLWVECWIDCWKIDLMGMDCKISQLYKTGNSVKFYWYDIFCISSTTMKEPLIFSSFFLLRFMLKHLFSGFICVKDRYIVLH